MQQIKVPKELVLFYAMGKAMLQMAEEGNIQNSRGNKAGAAHTSGWLYRYLPLLSWLPSYQRSWLRFDLIAGATVWAVIVPEAVAYSQLAGVPHRQDSSQRLSSCSATRFSAVRVS
jgi:hypothetical protein